MTSLGHLMISVSLGSYYRSRGSLRKDSKMKGEIMYKMKEACEKTGLSYETLKFYCNQGLVPNVKRDEKKRRVFDERDIAWINSLNCLRNCDMSIQEMREYIDLCLKGETTIPERKQILAQKRKALEEEQKQIQKSIDYIDWKQGFYDDILSGKIPYFSNLTPVD